MAANLQGTPSNVKVQQEQDRIKVAVRMRPANQREVIRRGEQLVIECLDDFGEIVVNDRYQCKKYNFDSVFGPGATQKTVFNTVVTSTLEEVLKGYSCTIFAYGQTGTGKTYTMEGERSDDRTLGWEDDPVAGIIPRTVAYFYDRLKNGDYSIRVSYLEIYNENLSDLLSARDGTAEVPLKICVNTAGIACVQNLTEHMVRTKDEVFELLQRGSMKRRTAETKMNERSSRSHAVFMITLVMQQKSDIGEEVVKTGKLYLVDLAGSENISRSGAQESRAQEAGNINKSLLTLGRVITALVERKPHIPYRDSKLTRLLQDSLGGRNKTTIIATLSPALLSLDESLSTIDYAFKAKNILNKPEINQRVSKDVHVKEVYAELEKAKRDLEATWAKMGVTLSKETYQNMQDMLDARREKIQALEVDVQQFQNLYQESKSAADGLKHELRSVQDQFRVITKRLAECRKELTERNTLVAGLEYVTDELRNAEEINVTKLARTCSLADETISHLSTLHNRLEVRSQIEKENEEGFKEVSNQIIGVTEQTRVKIVDTTAKHGDEIGDLRSQVTSLFNDNCQKLGSLGDLFKTVISEMDFFNKWCDNLTEKLRFGDETDKSMAAVAEKFSSMLASSRQEYTSFIDKFDTLCKESRQEAETKRSVAVTTLTSCEEKTVALVGSFKSDVEKSVSESVQEVACVDEQARLINELANKIVQCLPALQAACNNIAAKQNEFKSKADEFQQKASNLASENKEQSSKVVSQLVDSFYTKLYEINAEVHDHSENRQKSIETKGQSEIEQEMASARSRAVDLDTCLTNEITSTKARIGDVKDKADNGCSTVESTRDEMVELGNFIDSKLAQGMQVVQEGLGRIEEDVDLVSKLPTTFLSRDLRVYQPSGTTPKPQTWNIDRDPVVVPPNERLLSTFKPPSELIAAAEALEQADAEIANSVKITTEPSIAESGKSNSIENLTIDIPSLTKAATIGVGMRRALGPKAQSQQQQQQQQQPEE